MAVLNISIPDNQVSRINDAFAARFGHSAESGMTRAQFTKDRIIRFIKEVVHTHELQVAEEQARNGVRAAEAPSLS